MQISYPKGSQAVSQSLCRAELHMHDLGVQSRVNTEKVSPCLSIFEFSIVFYFIQSQKYELWKKKYHNKFCLDYF